MESNGPPGPKGVYTSLLPSQTRCPRLNEIPPYGSDENFLVTGLILLSLPTVAKGFESQNVGSTLCDPLSLSVHGQRESGSSTRRSQLPSTGKSMVALSFGFRHICSIDDVSEMVSCTDVQTRNLCKSADNSVALLWRWHLNFSSAARWRFLITMRMTSTATVKSKREAQSSCRAPNVSVSISPLRLEGV